MKARASQKVTARQAAVVEPVKHIDFSNTFAFIVYAENQVRSRLLFSTVQNCIAATSPVVEFLVSVNVLSLIKGITFLDSSGRECTRSIPPDGIIKYEVPVWYLPSRDLLTTWSIPVSGKYGEIDLEEGPVTEPTETFVFIKYKVSAGTGRDDKSGNLPLCPFFISASRYLSIFHIAFPSALAAARSVSTARAQEGEKKTQIFIMDFGTSSRRPTFKCKEFPVTVISECTVVDPPIANAHALMSHSTERGHGAAAVSGGGSEVTGWFPPHGTVTVQAHIKCRPINFLVQHTTH